MPASEPSYGKKCLFLPVRGVAQNIADNEFTVDALQKMQQTNPDTNINRTATVELLQQTRDFAIRNENTRLNFDNPNSMDTEDYYNLTGLTKDQFEELLSYLKDVDIRASKTRSARTCIAILLTKLRCGMSNHLLGTLFGLQKWQVRRAVLTAKHALMSNFVPHHLGFPHIAREDVKENHTRPLAKELLCNVAENPVILILDGTYIYLQKSGNFTFSRRSYSTHKHRPLVKPMIVVTTSGYIVSVLGPYLADSKNSDAKILTHMIETNVEEIKDWIQEDDIFIVDRGFRDAEALLSDIGIHIEMPSFLTRGAKQHSTEESNATRLVTKLRWVVESVNCRLKTWNYLDRTIPNSQIPHIGDYVRIISAICNKFRPDVSVAVESDLSTAAKMRFLSKEANVLKEYVERNDQSCVSIANGSFLAEPICERTTAMPYSSNRKTTSAHSKTTKKAQHKRRNWALIATIPGITAVIFIVVCVLTHRFINKKTEEDTKFKEMNGLEKKENSDVDEREMLINPKTEDVKSNEREKYGKLGNTRCNNNGHHKGRQDKSLKSDLFAACDNGHHNAIQDLLNKGVDVNTFSREDYTPLHIACSRGHTNTVQLLLKNNADINLSNRDGISPLYIACQNGHDRTVQLLLNKDVDINLCKNNGTSPLLIACKNGHECIVQRLLEKNANIDLCLNDGASPLFIACQNGHYKIVELLLRNGAALNNYRNDGASPLSIAIHKEYNGITQLLKKYGAYID